MRKICFFGKSSLPNTNNNEAKIDGSIPPNEAFKVILLGNSRAGKSQIVQRMTKNYFSEKYQLTVHNIYNVTVKLKEDIQLELNISDIGGDPRIRKMLASDYAKEAKACIFVASANEGEIKAILEQWKETAIVALGRNIYNRIPKILIVNKVDLLANTTFEDIHNLILKAAKNINIEASSIYYYSSKKDIIYSTQSDPITQKLYSDQGSSTGCGRNSGSQTILKDLTTKIYDINMRDKEKFELFKFEYFKEYKRVCFFKNRFSYMKTALQKNEIKTYPKVVNYAAKNKNSRTASVLSTVEVLCSIIEKGHEEGLKQSKINFKLFEYAYFKEYKRVKLFKNRFSSMNRMLRKNEIASFKAIEEYADKNKRSRTSRVLNELRSLNLIQK